MRIIKSFQYAWYGIKHTFLTQSNFRIHLLGFLFMNFTAYYFHFEKWEYLICLVLSALVFFAEVLNTSIEATIDLITKEKLELARIAKDCAAGAVLVLAVCALIVWTIIIYSKIVTH